MNSLIAFDLTFTGFVETAGLTLLVSAIPILLVALLGKMTIHLIGDPRARYATGVSTLFLIAVIPIATALLLVKLESGFVSLASTTDETSEPSDNNAVNIDRDISQRELDISDSNESSLSDVNPRRLETVGPGVQDKNEVSVNESQSSPVVDEEIAAIYEPTSAEKNQGLRGATVTVLAWTKTHMSPWMPWVVAVWGLGFVAFFGRVWIGSRYSAYIARHGLSIDKTLQSKLDHICRKENIRRRVSIFLSDLVNVPVVVGFFKSVILIPASTLTNLNSQELESILRHELAHIRRYDAVVNLLQTLLETTLFYHPAVWWVSRQVRVDRELCCDRWAAKNNGQAKTLARALLRLEESRAATPLMAANGGNLVTRIQRLLEFEKTSLAKKNRTGAVTLSALALLIACVAICGWVTQSDQRTQQENSVQTDDVEKADKKVESKYNKLVVTVYDEENQPKQLYVDDRAAIQTLLDFFPGAELDRQGMQPAGYTVDYHLVFSGPDKKDLRIGLSTRLMLWNAGKGDWKFKSLAQFRKAINEQFDRSKAENEEVLKQLDECVKRLGKWTEFNKFRSRPYMIVAHQLMQLSPDVRANVMKSWCKPYNDQVILLCKMLFEKAEGQLRRPSLGGPFFIDGGKIKDWPLEPITLVENVPFVVVQGYIIGGGRAETAKQYLAYCLKEGTWTSRDYSNSDQNHIEAALEKLLVNHPNMIEHARKILATQVQLSEGQSDLLKEQLDRDIELLPDWYDNPGFKSQPYMQMANRLLMLPPDDRTELLKKWAPKHNGPMFALCRMLFEKEGGFRRPGLGAPIFINGENIEQWPMEPITFVDDVPFVIVLGYRLAGRPELASKYLNYCLENCEWTNRDYSQHDLTTIANSFKKLVGRYDDLSSVVRSFLANQIVIDDEQTRKRLTQLNEDIKQLPQWYNNNEYRSAPYMKVAHQLQQLSPDKRLELLSGWTKRYNDQVFILCRMLFERDENFRRPGLGAPSFVDGSQKTEWPLEPITLINNVPFLVVDAYQLMGQAEGASSYLNYCSENCQWSKRDYSKFDQDSLNVAFEKLLEQNKHFDDRAKESLAAQVEPKNDEVEKIVERLNEEIKLVPNWYAKKEFRSAPYMKVAHLLQQLPIANRKEVLSGWVKEYNEQLFILCRMLFENKDGFRRPGLGGPVFVYKSDMGMEDWPLEPITLVDNVPFLIVDGYVLGGLPESSKSYLNYCYEQCQWSKRDYSKTDQDTLNTALNKLLADKKDRLVEHSTEQLAMQVAPQHLDWQLYGKVTDDEGNPLSDVEVRMATGMATLLGGGSAKTDKDGNYRLHFGEGIWSNEGPNMQVAWLFVSKPGYVYKSNSRKIDLSMAMSRERLSPEQMPKTAWSNMRPNDLIVKNNPHKMNVVMSKPAEVLVTVFDDKGNRVKNSKIGVDDTNQTSEATDVQFAEDEKPDVDLAIGLATNKQWTLSVPLEGRRRQAASPMLFKDPGRYEIEVVLLESDGAKTLEIKSVKKADGSEVSAEVIFQAGPSLRPLGEELTAKAISHIKEMAKMNEVWLKPGQQKEIKWEDLEFEIEHDGEIENVKSVAPNQMFPVYRTALHYLVEKPDEAIYRQLNENESGGIVIAFSFKEPIRVSYGNGIRGKYHGFVQTNVYEGTLTIDGKTMTPKTLITNKSNVEFSDFIAMDRGRFAPRKMKIVQPLACEWKFDIYQGGIWMLDSIDDGRLEVKKITQGGMPLNKLTK